MYKNKKDKELALKSVKYKDFFFRADKLDWETYESYSPIKEPVDYSIINDVNDAYNSLSDELKNDFDVVTAALDSYKKITEYLKTAEPIAIYSDGVGINVDTDAMINIIQDEYIGFFEEKRYDFFGKLVENIIKDVAIDVFSKEIEDIQENISIAYSDDKIDFAEVNEIDIDKYFGKFVKRIFKNDQYRLDIDIYIDNIQEYCNFKKYTLDEFHTILSKVIMHELAHYYMFPAKIGDDIEKIKYANEPFHTLYYKDNCWYKTIEESLCN
jgi:predicted Zn-dependent protease with MMP-like domain